MISRNVVLSWSNDILVKTHAAKNSSSHRWHKFQRKSRKWYLNIFKMNLNNKFPGSINMTFQLNSIYNWRSLNYSARWEWHSFLIAWWIIKWQVYDNHLDMEFIYTNLNISVSAQTCRIICIFKRAIWAPQFIRIKRTTRWNNDPGSGFADLAVRW